MNRESNYRFSYKKMLSLTGNTAPYMLYAFARIQGIRRKALEALQGGAAQDSSSSGGGGALALDAAALVLSTPEERALAKQLLRLDEVLEEVARDLYPNKVRQLLVFKSIPPCSHPPPTPAVRVLVRAVAAVQPILRKMPGAQGRDTASAAGTHCAVLPHRRHAQTQPGPLGNRHRRKTVKFVPCMYTC
jgi:hypothetical protein